MHLPLNDIEKKVDAGFSVLYSGGLDSTAVPLLLGRKFTGKIYLHTLHHNYGNLFVDWSKKHAEDLQRVFGPDRVFHSITNITETFKQVTVRSIKKDIFDYGHFTWCLGCIFSLVARIIEDNLVNNIPYAFVCSSVGGEYAIMSMPASIATINRVCMRYGVNYRAPLLELNMRKPAERELLAAHEIWPGLKILKGVQGVQPICIPGFQHIMDNMFDLHSNPDPEKVEKFILDRAEVIDGIIRADIKEKNLDFDELVARLKEHHQKMEPFFEEESPIKNS